MATPSFGTNTDSAWSAFVFTSRTCSSPSISYTMRETLSVDGQRTSHVVERVSCAVACVARSNE